MYPCIEWVEKIAHALHVQFAPQVNYFHGVLNVLPECTNVLRLVPLTYNFTSLEDSIQITFNTSSTCTSHH